MPKAIPVVGNPLAQRVREVCVVRMRLLPLLWLVLAVSYSAFSAPQFTKCSKIIRSLITPEHETSVELEVQNTDGILSLLTTTDGTLGPLLPPKPTLSLLGFGLPADLQQHFQGLTYEQIAAEPWDHLSLKQKRIFLLWATVRKRTSFFEDRSVPGIKMKDKAFLHFNRPTQFLGREYEAGTHEVDISNIFRKVEYATPSQNPQFLELHFRTQQPAGVVSNSAWTFLAGIQERKIHQHVHIVRPLNINRLQEEGQIRSVLLTDFYRRANLVLEMMTIVEEKKQGITSRGEKDVLFWDNLSTERLSKVFNHLEISRLTGRQPHLNSQAKMAYVGFRGSDTYDNPELFGFEVRGISEHATPETIKQYLDTLQWAMTQDHFGVTKDEMEKWMELQKEPIGSSLVSTWYNQPWEKLRTNGHGHRFEELDPYLRKYVFDLEQNRELKMLLHDWSNDPLLFNKPKLINHIRKEQLKALETLNSGVASPQRTIRDFLIHSGLYGIFTRSLGQ